MVDLDRQGLLYDYLFLEQISTCSTIEPLVDVSFSIDHFFLYLDEEVPSTCLISIPFKTTEVYNPSLKQLS